MEKEKVLYAGLLLTIFFLFISVTTGDELIEKFCASLSIISGVFTIKQLMSSVESMENIENIENGRE